MKNLKYLFTAICLIGILSGCYKDDSTSFSVPLAGVTIASHEKMPFFVGIESDYTPTIEWNGTSPEDYEYKWTLNGREIISTDLTLKYTFKEMGDVFLTFQMTDKETGLVYGKDFSASVTAKYFLGWVILSEGANQESHLSFIEMDEYIVHPDIFAQLNPGETLGSKPYGLANSCIAKQDQIMVLQEGGEGSVSLNGLSFTKVATLKSEFMGEQYPEENFKAKSVLFSHRGTEMLISESGNMYDRINATARTSTSAKFQDAAFTTQPYLHMAGDAKYTHHTFAGGSTNFTALYDGMNRRWLGYNTVGVSSAQKGIPEFSLSSVTFPEGFNFCTGMAEDVELIFAESHGESTSYMKLVNVLKRGDTYYANQSKLTLSTSSYKVTVSEFSQKEFANGYTIDENTVFCMPRGTGTGYNADPYIFFNVGQKVYFFHYDTGLTYLFRDFSKDENAPQGEIVAITQRADTKELGVTFSDGHFFILDGQATTCANIRQNNLDPENVDNGLVKAHITGLPGKPVATIFKFGKAANYTGAKVAY